MNKTIGVYVFNLADVAITIGVGIMLFALAKKRKLEAQSENTKISDNDLSLDGESS